MNGAKMKATHASASLLYPIEIYELCNKFEQIDSLMFKIIIIRKFHVRNVDTMTSVIIHLFCAKEQALKFFMITLFTHAVNDTLKEPIHIFIIINSEICFWQRRMLSFSLPDDQRQCVRDDRVSLKRKKGEKNQISRYFHHTQVLCT